MVFKRGYCQLPLDPASMLEESHEEGSRVLGNLMLSNCYIVHAAKLHH